MNCCNNDNKDKKLVEHNDIKHNCGNHKKHHSYLHMIICCLVPIIIFIALSFINPKLMIWSNVLFLLCPLIHIGMIVVMFRKK